MKLSESAVAAKDNQSGVVPKIGMGKVDYQRRRDDEFFERRFGKADGWIYRNRRHGEFDGWAFDRRGI
jgi:hypothetical protein